MTALTVAMIAAPTMARAGIVQTVEAATVETSPVAGATTETFDGFAPGNYSSLSTAVGTLSTNGAFAIVPADGYGGAGGSGNYFSFGAQSGSGDAVTLTLNGPQAYFGMWWSAADANNEVQLYSSGVLLATYTTADIFTSLDSSYNGNPAYGQDNGEQFAYVNFTGTSGTTFDQVVFSNNDTSSTGFESDNWSVAVPEPSSAVLAGISISFCVLTAWRRRRRAGAIGN